MTGTPATTNTAENNQETTPSIRINGDTAEPLGVEVNLNNVTVQLTSDGVTYPAGIAGELLAVTDHYEEVTGTFEGRFDSAYRFRVHDTDQKPWFHKADFWPYTDDSADNLFHYTRYAYTHSRNTDISLTVDVEDIEYPFSEHAVITFFDPAEERVRVFAGDENARSAGDIASLVFQPKIHVFAGLHGDLLRITIDAKSFEDPNSDVTHEPSVIDAGHIGMIAKATVDGPQLIWKRCSYEISGSIWDVVKHEAAQTTGTVGPDSFRTYHTLFLDGTVETPETIGRRAADD